MPGQSCTAKPIINPQLLPEKNKHPWIDETVFNKTSIASSIYEAKLPFKFVNELLRFSLLSYFITQHIRSVNYAGMIPTAKLLTDFRIRGGGMLSAKIHRHVSWKRDITSPSF